MDKPVIQVLTSLVIVQSLLPLIQSDATLKLYMVQYDNRREKDWNGNCCDQWCIGKCDHRFTFCVDRYRGNKDFSTCAYRREQTGEFPNQNINEFGSKMSGVSNPLVINFNKWLGGILFKVGVWDDDSGHSGHDEVDKIYKDMSITPDRSISRASWRQQTIKGSRTKTSPSELTLRVMLYCEADYYGPDCYTYCKAQDDKQGHYRCDPDTGHYICLSGWETPSTKCTIKADNCEGVTCQNGGYCVDKYNAFTCECVAGFTGTYCETDLDECRSDPCLNGGTCMDQVDSFECACQAGYVGPQCEGHVCTVSSPCKNGGSCYGTGECYCLDGYVGSDCSIHKCDVTTCRNGGTCLNDGTCECPEGLIGADCNIDPCDTFVICANQGTCVQGHCLCMPDFTGRYCTTRIDDCVGEPCLNDGVCDDEVDGYNCRCQPDYNGTHCEDVIEPVWERQIFENSTQVDIDVPTVKNGALPVWAIVLIVVVFLLVIIICIVVSLVWFYKRRAHKAEAIVRSTGFENPDYMGQVNWTFPNTSPTPISQVEPNGATPNIYHNETGGAQLETTPKEDSPKEHIYDNPALLNTKVKGGEYAQVPPPLPVRNQSTSSSVFTPTEEQASELPIKQTWPPSTGTNASGQVSPVPDGLGGDGGYVPMGSNC